MNESQALKIPLSEKELQKLVIADGIASTLATLNPSNGIEILKQLRPNLFTSRYKSFLKLLSSGKCVHVGVLNKIPYIDFYGECQIESRAWRMWIPLKECEGTQADRKKLPEEDVFSPLIGIRQGLELFPGDSGFEFPAKREQFSTGTQRRVGGSPWNEAEIVFFSGCGDHLLWNGEGKCCWYSMDEDGFRLEDEQEVAIERLFDAIRFYSTPDCYSVEMVKATILKARE